MANGKKENRRVVFKSTTGHSSSAELDALVLDVLGRGVVRFTRVGELVGSISQRMLTKTLRQMEADGLVLRTVHPEVPPRVEYSLTELGTSLCAAFCEVWQWAERHEPELRELRKKREPS
jgi:DNA-binding HxlR family transcriptional regulator